MTFVLMCLDFLKSPHSFSSSPVNSTSISRFRAAGPSRVSRSGPAAVISQLGRCGRGLTEVFRRRAREEAFAGADEFAPPTLSVLRVAQNRASVTVGGFSLTSPSSSSDFSCCSCLIVKLPVHKWLSECISVCIPLVHTEHTLVTVGLPLVQPIS